MKKIIYIYVLDTLADCEIGYVLQAISMQNMIKESKYIIKTVGIRKEPIKTLGGLTLIPDISITEINENEIVALLLPGANTWHDEEQKLILEKANLYVKRGILVAAICGATLALAELGILNNHAHTSNSIEYLSMFSKKYKGQSLYINELSVINDNVITASSAGSLLWAKQIIEYLNIYSAKTIQAWYNYYLTGDAKYYVKLMSSFE